MVISFIGQDGHDLTGSDFKHGNIVEKGFKGVWLEPLGPGKYPINKYTMKVELVPTTNLVLNWASARSEAHNLDKNLSTITVRSKDGFPFNLDVAQIIHVPTTEAPKVIARFGNMVNLVSQGERRRLVHANNLRGVNETNTGIAGMGSEQWPQNIFLTNQKKIR